MIAIAGGKGGCGKTTTVVSLARELAAGGTHPLVVDADVDMPNLHILTGTRRVPGLSEVSKCDSLDAIPQSSLEFPGVRVVAAGEEPPRHPAQALKRFIYAGEPVLVDTPAGASSSVGDPLRMADAVVIVSTPTRRSLTDAAKTTSMATALDTPVIGAVITQSDGSIDPSPLLECPVLGHVPFVDDPLYNEHTRTVYADITDQITGRTDTLSTN